MRAALRVSMVSMLLVAACGGPKAKDPSGGPGPAASATSKDTGDKPPADTPAAPRKACNDASCTPCGEGLCPEGFYCVKGKGASTPGCAWSPACVSTPTCACVKPSGCSCEDKGGVAQVTCG